MEPDFWNGRYEGDGYLFGTAAAAPLAAIANQLPTAGTALCLADGEGRNSVFLAKRGFTVTAFDFAENALVKARKLAKDAKADVSFHQADITKWAWHAQSYDLIAGVFFQFLPPELRAEAFKGITQALAPGGTLYILGYRPEQVGRGTGGPPHVKNTYSEELLANAFDALEIQTLRSWEEDLAE
ncbi:MAG: class I SAM-dependent methyltransferase, partial [Paracoccaceae bacterium]